MSLVKKIAERESTILVPRGMKGEPGGTEFGNINNVAANYNVLMTDDTVICNSAVAITLTLPSPTSWQILFIKNIGAGVVTVSRAGHTIDDEAAQYLNQYESLTLQYVAANTWVIL